MVKSIELSLFIVILMAVGFNVLDAGIGAAVAWVLILCMVGPIRMLKFSAGLIVMLLSVVTCHI